MKEYLTKNYEKCWNFFCESRWFVVFTFGFFSLTFLIGFAYPVFFRAEIFAFIEELILEIEGLGTVDLIGFIFLNNLMASGFAMVLGIFLGIFPLITTVVNGYLLGFVANHAVAEEGILTMWRILPHGVFELPAVIFSIGIGMRFGWTTFANRWNGKIGGKYVLKEGFRFFVFVVFPLLVVGAVIEGLLIGLGK